MPAALSARTRTVLAHLLAEPYGDHHLNTVSRALDMPVGQVTSAFTLLAAHGWAVYVDSGSTHKRLRLTQAGRHEAAQLVEAGEVGVPLRQLDDEDPALADLIRARCGWPARHR